MDFHRPPHDATKVIRLIVNGIVYLLQRTYTYVRLRTEDTSYIRYLLSCPALFTLYFLFIIDSGQRVCIIHSVTWATVELKVSLFYDNVPADQYPK